eukprot:scaffold70211_cov26-Prasinocladus_malaysianus.AAC.2
MQARAAKTKLEQTLIIGIAYVAICVYLLNEYFCHIDNEAKDCSNFHNCMKHHQLDRKLIARRRKLYRNNGNMISSLIFLLPVIV